MVRSTARLAAEIRDPSTGIGPPPDAAATPAPGEPAGCNPIRRPVTIPGQDPGEYARRAAALRAELGIVGSVASLVLADRISALSFRLERSARHEAAMTAERVRGAVAGFDEARQAAADRLIDTLAADPPTQRGALLATPEGVDRLLRSFGSLRRVAAGASPIGWNNDHARHLDRCRGLEPDGRVGLTPDQALIQIDGEVAHLETHRRALDHDAIARERAEVADRALVATTPETVIARRFEVAAERSIFRALRELQSIRRDHPAPAAPPTPPVARPASAPVPPPPPPASPDPALGSFVPEARATGWPAQELSFTAAKVPERPASRFEDRKKRPRIDR